jgi:hypothetical protein
MKSKTFEAHDCSVCGKTMKSKLSLDNHVRFVHEKKSHFKCDLCPEGTQVDPDRFGPFRDNLVLEIVF